MWRDVVGWDRLDRYTKGMVVYLSCVGKRRVRVGRHAGQGNIMIDTTDLGGVSE